MLYCIRSGDSIGSSFHGQGSWSPEKDPHGALMLFFMSRHPDNGRPLQEAVSRSVMGSLRREPHVFLSMDIFGKMIREYAC